MVDGSDDKAGIRGHLGRVLMANEIAAPTMRDDDEPQLVAGDGAIPDPRQSYVAELDLARRPFVHAMRPDSTLGGCRCAPVS